MQSRGRCSAIEVHGNGRHRTSIMDDLFVGVCFADLNVVAQESKRTNEAMLQALASCRLKWLNLEMNMGYLYVSLAVMSCRWL